ncbi:hypothetical protein B5K03_13695 [Rhizobium phaseoli]|nr:hypothetical protein B5K03_13695 [Rhizobium phaseoli]
MFPHGGDRGDLPRFSGYAAPDRLLEAMTLWERGWSARVERFAFAVRALLGIIAAWRMQLLHGCIRSRF